MAFETQEAGAKGELLPLCLRSIPQLPVPDDAAIAAATLLIVQVVPGMCDAGLLTVVQTIRFPSGSLKLFSIKSPACFKVDREC